jgi:hypothetical protein
LSFLELAKRLLAEPPAPPELLAASAPVSLASVATAEKGARTLPAGGVARSRDWRREVGAWQLADRVRWSQISAAIETLEGFPPGESDWLAYLMVSAELNASPAGPWVLYGSSGMALVLGSPPPWPDTVFRAAAIVEAVGRHHRVGEDALAAAAARQLDDAIEQLRWQGIDAWLTS